MYNLIATKNPQESEIISIEAFVKNETELIISGGAAGVDKEAVAYADSHGISKLILRPNFIKHGEDAMLFRNRRMLELCDRAVIIWDGSTNGTKQLLDHASKTDKDVTLVIVSHVKKKDTEQKNL